MAEHIDLNYKDAILIVGFYDNEYVGNVSVKSGGGFLFTAKGDNRDGVIKKLEKFVHSAEYDSEFKKMILRKYGKSFRAYGIDGEQIPIEVLTKAISTNHTSRKCWDCGGKLSEADSLVCLECKWLKCGDCNSCGCNSIYEVKTGNVHNLLSYMKTSVDNETNVDKINVVENHANGSLENIVPAANSEPYDAVNIPVFEKYSTALEYARKHPGTTVRMNSNEIGWTVFKKSSL